MREITTEEVEALAGWADNTARQQGPACLVTDHALSNIATTLRALDAERQELLEENTRWQRMSRERHAAFTAMRDAINEAGVLMPSAESALLHGPEPGPEHEIVANAVAAQINSLRAQITTLAAQVDATRAEAERLWEALEPFAEMAAHVPNNDREYLGFSDGKEGYISGKYSDFHKARAALAAREG